MIKKMRHAWFITAVALLCFSFAGCNDANGNAVIPVYKTLIITGGGDNATVSNVCEAGIAIAVSAGIMDGSTFDKWEATGITLFPGQETQSQITFIMPDNDVTLKATWTLNQGWTLGTIPFLKGVNFNEWLDDLWSGLPPNNRRWFDQYNESDFADLKSIGIDHIRLPVALHINSGDEPQGALDPVFLQKLDLAVAWAEKYEMYLIIDNHEYDGSGIDASIEPLLSNAWKQVATRYKDRSMYVIYEVLNEPCYIDAAVWNAIQGRVIGEIRKIDTKHYIIAGGTDWNSLDALCNLPVYPYERIIYTFHFYEPGILTHAGIGAEADVWNIPFPYDSSRMPSPPAGAEDWLPGLYASYSTDGTEASLAAKLDQAVAFAKANNVPVNIGEYGCNSTNILPEDRVRYYKTVTRLFRERAIPYANWGYKYNEFGMTNGRGGVFPGNLNVDICRAMGLYLPGSP